MKNYLTNKPVVYLMTWALTFVCLSCTAPKPAQIAFTSEWKKVFENAIAGDIEETTVSVITDGIKFKIEDKYSINVYDGINFYSKTKEIPMQDLFSSFSDNRDFLETQEREISETQAKQYMFWLRSQGKKEGPGGNIAGQETVLYQIGARRPDGELRSQTWVDAETGIVLKSMQTIYSTQIEQLVSKEETECTQIEYGYVDEENFNKP
ncbi:MAG: hypothetical protein ABII23_09080 [bacterium]